ncbi:heme biosynthesis protein HemY [Chenggangzhangella methanolivorans]|uniref:Tetratricopeptide repeat protein n=1 Tax=Chenggangzhangella methanolivorans TaxID=1437009 RepID=A0A9E6RCP2_9HYPH|nr:heme biosynthesis HemY N-terminal domain-containing protein [Chenggangzhangella methanolivorans]QZN98341.1 tetratricopeptide repeat protein [Chenggangzhangella methanolivorans]
MVRVLLYLVLVGIFACAAVWIADRPGDLVINWQGYRIETSVSFAAVVIAAVAITTVILWNVMRWILAGPEAFALFRRNRRRAKGYEAIARGVVAVGTGDAKRAGREASEARKLLGREPLTLVLAAQAAQLSGDGPGAEAAFRAMTERTETRSLGLRGLFVEAERRGDRAAAKALAEEAARLTPDTWAGQALFDYQCAEHDWAGALQTLDRLSANRLIDKADTRRRRAVLLTAQAMEDGGDPQGAVKRAREAHSLAPDFPPSAALAARLLAEQGDAKKAMKIVETTWAKTTHPDLAEVYVHVRPGDSARDKLKRGRSLSERSGEDPEGLIALARAAIAARELGEARAAIGKLLGARPTARACLLMAELEEIEHGEQGRAREWLGRALRAPRDPAWVADGVSSEAWAPVSPVTGKLDAFVWKIPVEESRPRLAAEAWLDQGPVEPLRALEPLEPVAPPSNAIAPVPVAPVPVAPLPREMPTLSEPAAEAKTPEPAKSQPAKPALAKTDVAKTEAVKAEPAKAAPVETVKADPSPVEKTPAKPESGRKPVARPTAAVFPLSRAPDDPGPQGGGEPADTVTGGQSFPAQRPNY